MPYPIVPGVARLAFEQTQAPGPAGDLVNVYHFWQAGSPWILADLQLLADTWADEYVTRMSPNHATAWEPHNVVVTDLSDANHQQAFSTAWGTDGSTLSNAAWYQAMHLIFRTTSAARRSRGGVYLGGLAVGKFVNDSETNWTSAYIASIVSDFNDTIDAMELAVPCAHVTLSTQAKDGGGNILPPEFYEVTQVAGVERVAIQRRRRQ